MLLLLIIRRRCFWAFIGVLGYIRYCMVRVVDGGDTATTLDALMIMFKELAGAPKKITSDNPKAFVIDASKYESKLNTVLSL